MSKLDQIQTLFNKGKQSGYHHEFLMLVLIAISIVIYGSKNDIYPLVYVKFSTNVLVIIKVY